jgi:hypothetical protein
MSYSRTLYIHQGEGLATFWRQTDWHPVARHETARYKLLSTQQHGGIKSYLAEQGGTSTHAFRERHHKPLGHISRLQILPQNLLVGNLADIVPTFFSRTSLYSVVAFLSNQRAVLKIE